MRQDERYSAQPLPKDEPHVSRVLIVEDDPAFSDFLAWSLSEHGYAVSTAANIREALSQLAGSLPAAEFDLILSDIAMPGSPGTDLLFSTEIVSRQTPVIFMSGYAPRELRAFVQDCGGDFLQKPFKLNLLFECIVDRLQARAEAGSRIPTAHGGAT
jgi:DNA-binding response OmpR family regulator